MTSTSSAAIVPPLSAVKPRRVLPEHEGKYKIKLPSGTTERSKQILAKQAKCKLNLLSWVWCIFYTLYFFFVVYSDREEAKEKSDIFQRLAKNSKDTIKLEDDNETSSEGSDIKMRITGVGSKTIQTSASIFSRLGGKSSDDTVTKQIKPILKNTAKNVSKLLFQLLQKFFHKNNELGIQFTIIKSIIDITEICY